MKYVRLTLFCSFMIALFSIQGYAAENNRTISSDDEFIYNISMDGTLYRWKYDLADNEKCSRIKMLDDVVCIDKNYAIKEDGTLWTWKNDYEPAMVMDSVVDVSVGSDNVLIVKSDGSLWGQGSNIHGQLAQGTMDLTVEEQKNKEYKLKLSTCEPGYYQDFIKIMDGVQRARAGDAHSIVLKKDGTVWTFGSDMCGELGDGNMYVINNVPTKILDNATDIFSGYSSGFALCEEGLYRWGTIYGTYSGNGPKYCKLTPVLYAKDGRKAINLADYNIVIKQDDSLWIYGESEDVETMFFNYKIHFEAPLKVNNDINDMVGIEDVFYKFGDEEKNVILKNNRELYLQTISQNSTEKKVECSYVKLCNNARLSTDSISQKQFNDISKQSKEVQKAINSLSKAEIIDGTSETEFSPDKSITRAEIAALLLRMSTNTEECGNGEFADVTKDKWYYNTAGASKKYNIVSGFEDNTFRGDETISKTQLISLVARTLKTENQVTSENDVVKVSDEIAEWAREDIGIALSEGLISESDLTNMNDSVTRGESSVILYRLYEKI